MKVKLLIIKILCFSLSLPLAAQYSEIGVFGGGSNFIGDVGNYGPQLPNGYAFGMFYKYNFNRHYAIRAGANYAKIAGADSLSNLVGREARNLSFQSNILEFNALLEFNFFEYEPGTKKNHTPYLLAGVGIFRFNPQAEYQGEIYDLQPLGTEGQGSTFNSPAPYPLMSSYFLMGVGYKFALGRFTTLGLEFSARTTNTDYLDDVSGQYASPTAIENAHGEVAAALADRSSLEVDKTGFFRGNPGNKDWYMFTGITLQVKFDEAYEKCSNFIGN